MSEQKIKLLGVKIAAQHARLYNMLDETAYRNNLIKLEFEQLKQNCPGETCESIIQRLAEKKWNGIILSYAQIQCICYPRGEAKEKMEMIMQLSTDDPGREPAVLGIQHSDKPKRRTYAKRR